MMVGGNRPAADDAAAAKTYDTTRQRRGHSLTYTVTCAECAEAFERSHGATRYGYALLCRRGEIDSE